MKNCFLIILMTALFGCSDDNSINEEMNNNDPIIGTWGNYLETRINSNGIEGPNEYYNPYFEILTYNSNGTITSEGSSFGNVEGAWEFLGNGIYRITWQGLSVSNEVEFICQNNIYKSSKDGFVNYYEKQGYNHDLCDEADVTTSLTYIQDTKFEDRLESIGLGDGVYENHYVVTGEINSVISLDIPGYQSGFWDITSLSGIEEFTSLETLNISGQNISSLDLSNNVDLVDLDCSNNNLSSLDLSQNTNLSTLNCAFNSITTLDLSNNVSLTELDCGNNYILTSLNLRNGNNLNVQRLRTHSNTPDCIKVDDATWSTENWIHNGSTFTIDDGTVFSENCN